MRNFKRQVFNRQQEPILPMFDKYIDDDKSKELRSNDAAFYYKALFLFIIVCLLFCLIKYTIPRLYTKITE